MEIRVDRESEVSIHQQVADQILYAIATSKLKPGGLLPSVRELARRLKIHHNTVSQAYQDLSRRGWVVGRHGSRLVVAGVRERSASGIDGLGDPNDLDELINATIRVAREKGYALQALRDRVRERMLEAPPDHILAIEHDPGLRRLMCEEIRAVVKCPVEGCDRETLVAHPGVAIGAIVVAPSYALAGVERLIPGGRSAISVGFASADAQIESIRKLKRPSVIAVVSVSEAFLRTARSLLAPALGRQHALREFLLASAPHANLRGMDVVFCDSITRRELQNPKAVHYRLLTAESLSHLSIAAMDALGPPQGPRR